ncbi:MAG TPA: hypothetical protein VK009_22240 [Chloroflexota bacterium]|nr:hypothetical protein [Chloroflexota bacterium]
MSTTVLHPVLLTALQSERSFSRVGPLAGLIGLVLAIVAVGLVIG